MIKSMAKDKNLLGSFCSELYEGESFIEHFNIYEKYIRKLGYDGACYTFLPKIQVANISMVNPIFANTKHYPIAFLKQYNKEKLYQYDFTIRKGKENCSLAPLDWREHELSGTLSDNELWMIKLARDKYGIKNAFTIPTQISDTILAGATVISFLSDNEFQKLKKETLRTLNIITKQFHDKCYAGSYLVPIFSQPLLDKLSPTELKAMRLLADGYTPQQLVDHMEIGKKYAGDIVCNLCKKLGGINRNQLFFLLGRINLLQLVE